ncbi:hypothetical protein HMPREF0322_01021 [Desulfitobacterium hafniense DP7]|uniref:Cation transport protein n=1 Tax=Desulfitobacterium hafniense DP7 TaxID=537010 RepID=G9XJ95_DESHA|nr:hypothetical protein HMPREF0322_01021 [Desulfitobacterium hafniense DP7]
MMFLGKFRANSIQMIALGFAGIILIGTLLLSLPAASRDGASLPFIDALFTSASATCVTGLVVHDTYTQFSLFGQIVILCLIQIGGLGFMTVATLFLMMARRKIGLAERGVLTESVSAFQIGGIVRLIRRIIICTAIVEGMGAILLAIRFCPQMGVATGVYYAIFHSLYMSSMMTMRDSVSNSRVIPVDSPTVPRADSVSKAASFTGNPCVVMSKNMPKIDNIMYIVVLQ